MNQNVANFDMDAIAALISAPTTDANSEFHSLTSTHAPNDNEVRLTILHLAEIFYQFQTMSSFALFC
jgi:hypothetical protein